MDIAPDTVYMSSLDLSISDTCQNIDHINWYNISKQDIIYCKL